MPNIGPARISQVTGAVTETIQMLCQSTAAVGNLVRQDLAVDNKVIVAVDNLLSQPVIGVIKTKITPTLCTVILRGVIDAIVPRGKVYLSAAGDFQVSPGPAAGYLQILGYSFGNGKLELEPNKAVTKQI